MALQQAIVALARCANTRSNYVTTALAALRAVRYVVYVNSTDRSHLVDRDTIEIVDDLNELPNTCAFECFGFTPALDQVVKIVYAGPTGKEFEGTITGITEYHNKLTERIVFRVTCTDYTRLLDAQLVTKAYGSQSATTTAQDIITNFTSGFTQVNIAASLATVAAIQFKMTPVSSALRQLCDAIGGDAYVDYDKDVHVFLTETTITPDTISTASTNWKAFKYSRMIDRVVNRIFVEGTGTTVAADVAVAETIIPVATISPFDPSAGKVVVGNQILTYTGRTEVAPGTAPTSIAATGAGIANGTYLHAITYVTAAGESTASPTASITLAGVLGAPSGTISSKTAQAGGSLQTAKWYRYVVTYTTASGETTVSTETNPGFTGFTGNQSLQLAGIQVSADSGVTGRKIYRTTGQASSLAAATASVALLTTIADNVTTTFLDTVADASLGVAPPSSSTATASRIALSGVLVGPSGTTSRRVYRTVASGSQLKLVATIADNTTTTYTDSTADGSLGANVPTTDTSGLATTGLSTTSGATSSSATSITLASAAAFASTGGWARIGDLTIRYTGTTAFTLTGIPASGAGSVTVSVPTGSLVQGLVALVGVPSSGTGSVVSAISNGDEINLLVQRDDTTSQTTYGVRQAYIQDRRLSTAGAQARGDAELALRKDPFTSGSFITTDTKVRSGRRLPIDMSAWGISGTFTITNVRMFWKKDDQRLQRQVTFASNTGQSDLYRLLRRLRESQQQQTGA